MLVVLLGLAGAIVAAVIGAWAVLRTRDPTPSRLELVDVTVSAATAADVRAAIFDIKVRNTGGQPAVIKRLVVHIHRVSPLYVRWALQAYEIKAPPAGVMPVTATYDVVLPSPEQLAGRGATDVTVDLSQVVKAGDADRFQIRAGQRPYLPSAIYLVRLELWHDAGASVDSPLLAVAVPVPGAWVVISPPDIRETIARFCSQVDEIRRDIDTDLSAAGLPAVDWAAAPPRCRAELPERLPSYDEYTRVYDTFWDPPRAIVEYLDGIEQRYRTLIEISETAAVVQDSLWDLMAEMRATLTELPRLRAEFG